MARHRTASLDRRGIADFDELIHKKIHRILRSCLIALYFDSTTLIEIAVHLQKTARCLFDTGDPGKLDRRSQSPPPPPPPTSSTQLCIINHSELSNTTILKSTDFSQVTQVCATVMKETENAKSSSRRRASKTVDSSLLKGLKTSGL